MPLDRAKAFSVPHLPKGVARLAFSARIGRALSHRARSASKKDGLATPFPSFQARSLLLQGGGLDWSPTAHVERPQFHRGHSVSTAINAPTKLARYRPEVVRPGRSSIARVK